MSDAARYMRFTRDAAESKSIALPAAGATAYTPFLDLGSVEPGSIVDDFDVIVEVPVTPNLANTKNVTITLQDSAAGTDGSDALAVAPIGPMTISSTGTGGAVFSQQFKLPPTVRQFIRLKVVADAASGDVTAQSAALSLVH